MSGETIIDLPLDFQLPAGIFEAAGFGGEQAIKSFHSAGIREMPPGAAEETLAGLAGMKRALAFDFAAENAGFDGDDAHVFQKGEMKGRFGHAGELRVGGDRHGEGQRFGGVFTENAARVEAVAAGVPGGASFAGSGSGAAGFGAVGRYPGFS